MKSKITITVFFFIANFMAIRTSHAQATSASVNSQAETPVYKEAVKKRHSDDPGFVPPANIRKIPAPMTPSSASPPAPAKAPSQGLPASVQPIHENDSDTKPKN